MTELEHSPVNRADEGGGRDQSGAEPRTPARASIDRAALIEVLRDAIPPRMTEGYYARVADRVLALVRPVEGVVLTAEEARLAERALREYGAEPHTLDYGDSDAMDALAARLEASA